MRAFEFLFQFLSDFFRAKNLIGKFVDKCAEGFCNEKGVLVVDGVINNSIVNSIVSVESTQIRESQEPRRKVQIVEFLSKSFTLDFSCIHHLFKTSAKHGASCTWREIKNRLSLTKEVLSLFGHVFIGLNVCSCWIANFPINLNNNTSAARTFPQTDIIRIEKNTVIRISADAMHFRRSESSIDAFIRKRLKDRMLIEVSAYTAMWANHRFCF